MLAFISILMVLALGYAYFVEGIFTAFLMCCNVFISGLVAFDFWEPIADQLEPSFRDTFLQGYEDAFALVLLFSATLGALRVLTNNLSNTRIEFDERAQGIGGAILGIMTGYLTAGFLSCVLQTMPFRTTFLGFDGRYDPQQSGLRRILPPDRAWLALMHYAGAHAFSTGDNEPTFDQSGTFELRYARYRRYPEDGAPRAYGGELEQEMRARPSTSNSFSP
jgi:Colicin V production protein